MSTDYKPVARKPVDAMSTGELLKALTPEIARALPSHDDEDAKRIARLVLTEIRKNPKLEQCTQASFAGALLTAAALGLEPGVGGECYLVPYRDQKKRITECQLIVGYAGILKLCWQSEKIAYVATDWVGANDEFGYTKGLRPELWHRPADGERGEPVAYYAIVRVKDADQMWDVFTPGEIARIRRGAVGPKGDVPDPQRWMERKVALRQVLKLAPRSTRLDLAVRADERGGTDLYRSQAMTVPALGELSDQAPREYIDGDCDEVYDQARETEEKADDESQ